MSALHGQQGLSLAGRSNSTNPARRRELEEHGMRPKDAHTSPSSGSNLPLPGRGWREELSLRKGFAAPALMRQGQSSWGPEGKELFPVMCSGVPVCPCPCPSCHAARPISLPSPSSQGSNTKEQPGPGASTTQVPEWPCQMCQRWDRHQLMLCRGCGLKTPSSHREGSGRSSPLPACPGAILTPCLLLLLLSVPVLQQFRSLWEGQLLFFTCNGQQSFAVSADVP